MGVGRGVLDELHRGVDDTLARAQCRLVRSMT